MGLRYNYKFGDRVGFFRGAQADASAGRGSMSPGTSATGGSRGGTGGGREDAQSQYGGAYNVDYRSQDNRSGREQVYGAETTPVTEVDLLETFKPEEAQPLFNRPKTVADFFAPKAKPFQTVATVRNPFTDLTKDVLNPYDDTQVDSLTEKDDEGIMATVKEILSNTLLGKGIGYLKEQYDKQKAKNLFANTMDPSPPPVDTIASLTAGLGGGEGQGLASIYTGPPAIRPVSTVVEEEEVDPRTAEMEAFRAILRRNLGLI